MVNIRAPIMGKTILPALTKEQVEYLIGVVESPRDKAIISLFTESGLRLSELAKIEASDIDWQSRTIPEPSARAAKRLWRRLAASQRHI